MSKYKRLTNKNWKENYDIFEDVCCDTCTEDCGECERNFNALVRLAELEDKIENGLLVPRYSILKDWQYRWWCVCEVDEQSRIIAQCKTEEEAKRNLEELEK